MFFEQTLDSRQVVVLSCTAILLRINYYISGFFLGDCMHNIEKKITLTKKVISLKSAIKQSRQMLGNNITLSKRQKCSTNAKSCMLQWLTITIVFELIYS